MRDYADPEWECRRAEALVAAVEAAAQVQRRHQFFVWSQGSLQTLLPHALAICGHYDRQRKAVHLEAFNSVIVGTPILSALTDGQSALMQQLVNAWIFNRGRALAVHVPTLLQRGSPEWARRFEQDRLNGLMLHGVSRPQRPNEIESLFIFASAEYDGCASRVRELELMLPLLHSTYHRVQAVEQEIGVAASRPATPRSGLAGAGLSERECQVLRCAQEGLSNQSIGERLGISALTVKNHIQNILRKLDASNRAQAVARAISLKLLSSDQVGTVRVRPRRHALAGRSGA